MGRPRVARFRFELGSPAGNRWDSYEHTTTGTLNLPARVRFVTCEMLAAVRTLKLELAHAPSPYQHACQLTSSFRECIEALGKDLDPWSFTANAGDNIALRLASTGFSGSLGLYGPNGGLVATSAGNGTEWARNITPTNSGTNVALVGSYFGGGTGSYVLHYFKTPGAYIVPAGDEGGLMTNGGDYAGTITLADIDPWSFNANAGDNLVLRLGSTGFEGTMTLYGPDGSVLSTSGGNGTDWIINYRATNSGTFTVLVSSYFGGGTGSYVLHYFDSTGGFIVPAGDEGGPMTNGSNYAGTLALGDLDPWSFTANAGDNLVLRLGSTGFEGTMTLYGPDGSVLSTSGGNGTDWIINYRATNSGTFTVLRQQLFRRRHRLTCCITSIRVVPSSSLQATKAAP